MLSVAVSEEFPPGSTLLRLSHGDSCRLKQVHLSASRRGIDLQRPFSFGRETHGDEVADPHRNK